jgi:hypothetical protein
MTFSPLSVETADKKLSEGGNASHPESAGDGWTSSAAAALVDLP